MLSMTVISTGNRAYPYDLWINNFCIGSSWNDWYNILFMEEYI